MQEELFNITVNNEGRSQILRLFGRIKIVFILSLILTFISLVETFARTILYSATFRQMDSRFQVQLIASYAYSFVGTILFVLQVWYYYHFSKQISESLHEQNSNKFNVSFVALNTNAGLGIVSLVVSIAYTFLNIFTIYSK